MANPTTNRPTRPVFDATLGFGATAKSVVAFGSTAGLPIEHVGKVACRPWEGLAGYGQGYCPRNKATGFPYTPDAGSPSLKWGWGCPELRFVGRGFFTGDGNLRTYAVVFRFDTTHPPGVALTFTIPIVRSSDRALATQNSGLCVQTTTSALTLRLLGASNAVVTVGSLTLTAGHWYAAAVSIDLSGGSGLYKYKMQLYDYNTQTESTAAEITNGTTSIPLTSSQGDLVLGGETGAFPFRGQMANALLDKQYWSQANFQAYYADPWATVRGTYTPAASPSLAAPANGSMTHGEGGIAFSFPHATGTGTGGTGSPTYHLQRYTDPTTAPGSGSRVLSNISPDAGGATVNCIDTTPTAQTTYWYRLECVDGSDTVYYPASGSTPLLGRRRANGTPLVVAFLGDSRVEDARVGIAAQRLARVLDRPVCWMGLGKSGLYSYNWSNGTTARNTLTITGGVPTSGKFNLTVSVNAVSLGTTANIAYNADAATVAAAINALSASAVTCTGGPLPGTPITIDFTAVGNSGASYAPASSTMNNSALPTLAVVYTGKPADTTYFTPMVAQVLAAVAEDSDLVPYVHQCIGTNDEYAGGASPATAPVDFGRYLASGNTYMVSNGLKVVYSCPPLFRAPATNNGTPSFYLASMGYPAQLAALADGVNVYYNQPTAERTLQMVAIDPLGTTDGLHSVTTGQEYVEERWAWGDGLAAAVSPTAATATLNMEL